jgi:Zn-dependent alcohol dehydrogenase
MRMLTDGLLREDDLITARYPFARVAEAFADAAGGRQVKVVVTADD